MGLRHIFSSWKNNTSLITYSLFTSQPSGWKKDTRPDLRHNCQAISTILVSLHLLDLRHSNEAGSKRFLITKDTPLFKEDPFGIFQYYLESAQTLHDIEAWSTHQQPVHLF
jgi:hypothetical protein